jgi:raffinose/stachyose/melibiose transport system permease protein
MTDWNVLDPAPAFVGLANYQEALTDDPAFIKSIAFTLKYVVCMVVLQNALALILALMVESRKKSNAAFRTILFLPNMISMIVAGFIWMFVFTRVLPEWGRGSPFLSLLDRSWIGDASSSFWAIITVSLWGGVGYLMVIYIAALQGVSQQLKDAARIDGAGSLMTFRAVTLPLIMPSLTIGVFLTLNGSFKVFDVVFALTGGGPGRATQPIALNVYEEAFRMSNRYGYASVKAFILFIIVLAITLVQISVMKKREIQA